MSALDEVFRCSRGWLLEPQDDGVVLPFFIKSRYNDIIVYPNMIYDDELLSALEPYEMTSHSVAELRSNVNGWDVAIDDAQVYTGKIAVPIVNSTSQKVGYVSSDSSLLATVTLPFATLNDGDFSVSVTAGGISKILGSGTFNVALGTKSGSSGSYTASITASGAEASELFVSIHSSQAISSSFASDAGLQASCLYITVTGTVYPKSASVIPTSAAFADYSDVSALALV